MKTVKKIISTIWHYLRPVILLTIAYFALKYLFWFGIIYTLIVVLFRKKECNEPDFPTFLERLAVSYDQTLNALLQFPLNDFMRLGGGVNYGNIDETISGVTGKNQRRKKLTWFGKAMNWMLHKLEKDHSIKSIEDDEGEPVDPAVKFHAKNQDDLDARAYAGPIGGGHLGGNPK